MLFHNPYVDGVISVMIIFNCVRLSLILFLLIIAAKHYDPYTLLFPRFMVEYGGNIFIDKYDRIKMLVCHFC